MGPKKCLTNQRVCKNWDTKSIVINLVFNFYFSHVCVLSVSNACLDFSFWRNWKFMYHFLCFSSSSSSAPPPLRDFVICILSLHFWHISPSSYPLYLAKIVGSHFRIFWSRALILKPRMTMVQIQKILRRFFRVLYNPCRTWKLMKIVRVKRELKISFEIVIFFVCSYHMMSCKLMQIKSPLLLTPGDWSFQRLTFGMQLLDQICGNQDSCAILKVDRYDTIHPPKKMPDSKLVSLLMSFYYLIKHWKFV